ncbi:MAG: purine-nucleoside phosphorylase, partial [Dysgonamonadaceae bacterium]|nr:purine-nucleoside phosphorylase [Dysgonamonadaceae bacterium]
MDERIIRFRETADFIVRRTAATPEIGIVLGSGLGMLADTIGQPVVLPYAETPHFVHSTATGHKGN